MVVLRRSLAAATLVVVAVLTAATAASATVTPYASSNTQPVPSGNQNPAGACDPGERWVYVSSSAQPNYNPLGKTTDNLGASAPAPPNTNADLYDDGVTISISADGKSASYSVDPSAAPTIAIGKVVVKADGGFSVYTGTDAAENTPLTYPPGSTMFGVSHAYVCYSATGPDVLVPETPMAIFLPLAAIALGATLLVVRRVRSA